jgi:O-antigen/teichoic acid export membrane protein
VAGSTWVLGFAVTVILGFISLLAYLLYNGDPAIEVTIKWFGIIFFSTLPSSIALWILQAEERFDRVFILQLIGQGTFFSSVLILIFIHHTSFQSVIYGYFISAAFTSIIATLSGWAKLVAIAHKTKECINELVAFGKYSIGASISSYLLRSSDTFIIKYMFTDPAIVGFYYLPQRLMEIIEIPLRSFISTAFPMMSAAVYRKDEHHMTYIMKKYAGILTILLIPVSIAAFIGADLVIQIIGGQNFEHSPAANVFRIFMCFAILLPVDRFFGITLDILNKPHYNMIKVLLMLIVNVVGDFIGIYLTHNIYGVAISSIFTFLVGIIYGYWVLKKNLSFTIRDILKLGAVETKIIAVDLIKKAKQKTAKHAA